MVDGRQVINLPMRLRRKMLRHVRSAVPEEACGFLAGVGSTSSGLIASSLIASGSIASAVVPVTNSLHSPVRFIMEPMEQYRAMQWIEQNALEILAIYHSHPSGPPVPSATDLAEHAFPDAFCMIWSPSGSRWHLHCFRIDRSQFEELSINSGV